MNEELFKISGYSLDSQQKEIVLSNYKNILVVAGAGSGKSLTIVGKIKYLIEEIGILEDEILCVSFTNDSCASLSGSINKNGYNVEVLTFHKLALKILKDNKVKFSVSSSDYLEFIANEFFSYLIYYDKFYLKILFKYLGVSTLLIKDHGNFKKYLKKI